MFFNLNRCNITISLLFQSRQKYTKPRYPTKLERLLSEMPTDRPHLADAQKQRLKIKEKNSKYVPGTVTLQVLGSGAPGAPASVYLFTDQSRYMFNCGEGTQRLAHEHKTKLSRLEHIFLTRTSWSRLGGLPGLSLTVQDAGVPNLTLHGPPGLDELYSGMRRFVILKDLTVQTVDCTKLNVYDDQVLTVTPILINRKKLRDNVQQQDVPILEMDNTDYFSPGEVNKSVHNDDSNIVQNKLGYRDEHVAITYICKLKPKPGSLNLEKCVDKGIRPGPILGQLKNGCDVTLPNGTIVRADDVRGPTDPGPVFIFIDIPSEEFLESFEENSEAFAKYQSTAKSDEDLALTVVHFSPAAIVNHPKYELFMDKFSPSTKHLILNSTNVFSGYLAAHRIQHQLNQLSKTIFPLLKETTQEGDIINNCKRLKVDDPPTEMGSTQPSMFTKVIADYVRSLTCFHLRPRKGLDRSQEPILNGPEYIRETHNIEGFVESLEALRSKVKENSNEEKFPKVVFLGTGSCIPNKTRNVSSILVHVNKESNILLDCGEGTWGQMVRFYGSEKANDILKNLKAIYISHLHADHHIGLMGILKERQLQFSSTLPKLLLFAPKQIQYWLNFYNHRIEPIEDTYKLIYNGDMIATPFSTEQSKAIGIDSVSTCLVKHCPHSFGVALELSSDKNVDPVKITYSGDTMPCNDLVELGMNSTILIHEATMEDELVQEANIKMHSTVSQAIEQGNKMKAKHIILTHFSQRYAKLPRIETSMSNNIGIAFDNMQITLDDIQNLNLMYPVMKLMFTDHYEEMAQKALKRAIKKERKRLSSSSLSLS